MEIFRKIHNNKIKNLKNFKLLDNIDLEKDNYVTYYCANVIENLFPCQNELIYIKDGGFGLNYRYCSSCYKKWNELKNKNKKIEN